MIVIITEDSVSGYKFYKDIKEILFKNDNKIEIVIARAKNHKDFGGNSDKRGGISNVSHELKYQVNRLTQKKKHQDKKHLIFLAVDQASENSSVTVCIKRILKEISKYERSEKFKNIDFLLSDYYCMEEMFLGFKYLLDYINLEELYTKAQKKKVKYFYDAVYNSLSSDDYNNYVSDVYKDIGFLKNKEKQKREEKGLSSEDIENYIRQSRERVASYILTYITTSNRDLTLDVTKKIVSPCWFFECNQRKGLYPKIPENIKVQKSKKVCSKCKLKDLNYSSEEKLKFFLENSLYAPHILTHQNIEQYLK